MAIRVPSYGSQVGISPEAPGVPGPLNAPGQLESVEAAGRPGLQLAKTGEQLSSVTTEIGKALYHGQAVDDFNKMNLQMRLGLNQLSKELQADPGAPEIWAKRYEEGAAKVREEVIGLSSNRMAKQSFDKAWSIFYPTHLQEITAKGNVQRTKNFAGNFEESYPQYAELYAQAGDELSRAQIKDTVDNYINAAVTAGILHPNKGTLARQNFIPEAMKARALADIANDPVGAQAKLANFKENYPGLADRDLSSLNYQASGGVHRLQQANADNLDNQFMRGTGVNADPKVQLPTQQQIYDLQKSRGLASHDAWRFDKILEGMKNNPEDKSDPNIKTRLWAGIVPDDDGKITTTREMILDPQNQLSANDRISMLKDLRATDRQDQKAIVTFERGQISSIKNALGPNYFQRFYNDYLTEKKTANWETEEQIEQNINRIADPWLQKVRSRGGVFSNQPPPQPGWGGTIRNFFTGGGNASTQAPAGTMRMLNKRTGQMEPVTPEQFNQIQQYKRGLR